MASTESEMAWRLPSRCSLCHVNHHPRYHAIGMTEEEVAEKALPRPEIGYEE